MIRRRIGNDIDIEWSVFRGDIAEDFTDKTIKVYIIERCGKRQIVLSDSITVSGNTITFTWKAGNQYSIGNYSLVLEEYQDNELCNTVDIADAIEIVANTALEDGDSDYIADSSVTFRSDFNVVFRSIDKAYTAAESASEQARIAEEKATDLGIITNAANDAYKKLKEILESTIESPSVGGSGDSLWSEDENGDLVPKQKEDGTIRGIKPKKIYIPNSDGSDVSYRFYIGEVGAGANTPTEGGGSDVSFVIPDANFQYGILSIDGTQVGVLSINGHKHIPSDITGLDDLFEVKQDKITIDNKLDYALLKNTPDLSSLEEFTIIKDQEGNVIRIDTNVGMQIGGDSSVLGKLSMSTLVIPNAEGVVGEHTLMIGEVGAGADTPSGGGGADVSSIVVYDANGVRLGNGASDGKITIVPYPVVPTDVSAFNNDAGYLKEEDIEGKVDKVDGKGLSTEDFTTALKNKLQGLSNYDDSAINEAIEDIQGQIDTLVSGDAATAIESFNEIIAFLDGVEDTETLEGIIAAIEQQIASKVSTETFNALATRVGTAETAIATNKTNIATNATDITNLKTRADGLQGNIEDLQGDVTAILDDYLSKANGGIIKGAVTIQAALKMNTLYLPNSNNTPSDYQMSVGSLGSGADTPSGGGGADVSSIVVYDANGVRLGNGNSEGNIVIAAYPTSLPASDVYAWAKAETKPTYTKSEVGLGNVDNTSDSNKIVKAVIDYNDTTRTVYIGYAGTGLTATDAYHLAAYSRLSDGRQVIKDISKDNVKTWLGLDDLAYLSSISWNKITSDKPTTLVGYGITDKVAYRETWNNFVHSGNEFTFVAPSYSGDLWFNYRTASGALDGAINEYKFAKGAGQSYANIRAAKYIVNTGTSSQFLKADGSLDGTSYLPLSGGTLTSASPPLKINRRSGNSVIEYQANDATIGILGFDTDGTLIVRPNCQANSNYYNVIHSGNIGSRNAGSATKLQTARKIWGQSFDGSGNVNGIPEFPYIVDINRTQSGNRIDNTKLALEIEAYSSNVRFKTYGTTNNTSHLVLTSGGNVGIGTSAPQYKLDVNGQVAFGYSSACDVYLRRADGYSYITATSSLMFCVNGASNNYALGIDTSKNATFYGNVYVNGNVSATSDISINNDEWAAFSVKRSTLGVSCVGGIDGNGVYFAHTQDSVTAHMYLKAGKGLQVSGNISANGIELPTKAPDLPTSGKYYLYVGTLGTGATIS